MLYFRQFVWLLLCMPYLAMTASEDTDLNLIPDEVMSQPTPPTTQLLDTADKNYRFKVFLDNAVQNKFTRDNLAVPLPPAPYSSWNNRLSLDMRFEVKILPTLSLTIADRLNHFIDTQHTILSATMLNDLKEAYITFNINKLSYMDIGRVNLKSGVALGFNPTDFFKKDAVSNRISEDPSVLRENRLGTLMLRGQSIWEKAAVMVAFSPKVATESATWWTTQGSAGLQLNRTNSHNRFLAKTTINFSEDFAPEFLYYHEDTAGSSYGFNLTNGLGDNKVVYLEWSGSKKSNLFTQSSTNRPFRQQVAVGFSYTEKNINRTTYLEYHYNQAGFTRQDWQNFFDKGAQAALNHNFRQLGQLWSMRQFAQDTQEPLNRHSVFIRSAWQDVMIKRLDLTGIMQINLSDSSVFLQPLAEYRLDNHIVLNIAINWFLGKSRSEYGSLQQSGNIKLGISYYF